MRGTLRERAGGRGKAAAIVGGHERSTRGRGRGPTSSSAPSRARTRRSPTSCSSRSSAATSAGHEASSRGSSQPASGSAGRPCGRRSARSRRAGSSSRAGERNLRRRAGRARAGASTAGGRQPCRVHGDAPVLEVAVARLAAARRVRREARGAALTVEASSGSRIQALRTSSIDFHRGIVGLTGNEHLIALLEPMWGRRGRPRTRRWAAGAGPPSTRSERPSSTARSTRRRAGDPELAAFAMERHLRALMATLFEDEAFEGPPPRSPASPTQVNHPRLPSPMGSSCRPR